MKNAIASLLFVSLIGSSLPTSGEVFKCVDETTGKMTFTDVACPDKGAGDYVPVTPTNADSGYPSSGEIAASQRERDARVKARNAEWQRMAAEQQRNESVATHEKKADRLSDQVLREKDFAKRASLVKQAEAERLAAGAASQGNTVAEKHYEDAARHAGKAANSKGWDERIGHAAASKHERETGRAAQGLPPTEDQPKPRPDDQPISQPADQPISQPAAKSRPTIVNPDQGGAWDTDGNRYNKGAGDTYFRSDGKACQLLNTGMQCN